MDIKVLGPGCAKCKKAEDVVRQAVEQCKVEAVIEKVTGAMDIAAYGVFGTPAVVIDGDVRCVGKIPSMDDVKSWINK